MFSNLISVHRLVSGIGSLPSSAGDRYVRDPKREDRDADGGDEEGEESIMPSSKRNLSRSSFTKLDQLPNVGPAVAVYLRRIRITKPADLCGRDPYKMYDDLCRITGKRFDPCLLDTFIAVVRFMDGGPAKPWWKFTGERKRKTGGGAGL